MTEEEIAALRQEIEELKAARDFYEERALIEERVHRELIESVRAAGFSTQYFDGILHCFPRTMGQCRLRDRIAETVYEMARHLAVTPLAPDRAKERVEWLDKTRRLLQKLRAIDFTRYQREMERR